MTQTHKNQSNNPCATIDQWELFKIRYDYSWKSFDFHAKQRMSMFNFFIIFAGVLANAYGHLIRGGQKNMAIIFVFAGAAISFLFNFLDRRNEELVHIAEDNLRELERDIIFKGFCREIDGFKRRNFLGWTMSSSRKMRQLGIHLREESEPRSSYEHGRWLPVIQCLIAFFFILVGFMT